MPYAAHIDTWLRYRLRGGEAAPPVAPVDCRAAQYLRVSTPHQRQAMLAQKRVISQFAEDNRLNLVATYEDMGRSGVTAGGRTGLSQLLLDIVSGKAPFSHLIILDVSRWGRFQDFDEAAHYEFVCRANGVSVTYCREPSSNSPAGQLEKQVRRVMAGEYSRQLSDRTRQGKRRSAEAGNAPGNWPRYLVGRQIIEPNGEVGPRLGNEEFRTHPLQALRLVPCSADRQLVVQRIFTMFEAGGISMAEIASSLNLERLFWFDGSPWTKRRVRRVLRDPLVIGVQLYGRSRTVLGVRGTERDETRWGEVRVFEPIVPAEKFHAVQRRLELLSGKIGYSDDEMIEGLRALLRESGRLSAKLVDGYPGIPCSRRYASRFGNLATAWRLAGYAAPRVSRGVGEDGQPLSRAAVLDRLRSLRKEKGKINQPLIVADHRLPSQCLIKKTFGSLSAAYREAGLNERVPNARR